MARKIVYLQVKMVISNDNESEITEEMVNDVISETDYHFNNVGDFQVNTEIMGYNDRYNY